MYHPIVVKKQIIAGLACTMIAYQTAPFFGFNPAAAAVAVGVNEIVDCLLSPFCIDLARKVFPEEKKPRPQTQSIQRSGFSMIKGISAFILIATAAKISQHVTIKMGSELLFSQAFTISAGYSLTFGYFVTYLSSYHLY